MSEIRGLITKSLKAVLKNKPLGNYICSDLSVGAWRGHTIARELSKQLGLDIVKEVQPRVDTVAAWVNNGYSETVGKLIDTECIGDMNIYAARKYAVAIANALTHDSGICVYIILPQFGSVAWGKENFYLIQYLQRLLPPENLYLIALDKPAGNLPLDVKVTWEVVEDSEVRSTKTEEALVSYPGIIEKTIWQSVHTTTSLAAGIDFWPLPNGSILIDPAIRELPKKGAAIPDVFLSDDTFLWMKAFWLLFSGSEGQEELIRSESGKRFSEGGFDTALCLLEIARESSKNDITSASITAQIQGIRIALLDFRSASQEPEPSDTLPVELQAVLFQSIAWGMVMTGQADKAEIYFQFARTNLKGKAALQDYLYLLNISALTKLRIGKTDEAFAFEKEIEWHLSKMEPRDLHLIYINSINQARLYKLKKDFEVSANYYKLAFSTNEGLRQTSDLIYQNVCFAQLLTAKNDAKIFIFIHWFRAALLWLAEEVPEALAPRVVQSITKIYGKKLDDVVESVSEAMFTNLVSLIDDLKLFPVKSDFDTISFTPNFHFSDSLNQQEPDNQRKYLIGNQGWSVIVSDPLEKSIVSTSVSYHKLAALVTYIIKSMSSDMIPENNFSIYIDHRLGRDVPATKSEVLSCCERLRIPMAFFGSDRSTWDATGFKELSNKKLFSHSKAIKSIQPLEENEVLVFFKRFHPPVTLKGMKATIMTFSQNEMNVAEMIRKLDGGESENLIETLNEMEQDSFLESRIIA